MVKVRLLAANTSIPSSSSDSSLAPTPAVCTPDLCLVGENSLTAGVLLTTPSNGTTQLVSLLPGTYTSSSPAPTSSNSTLSSSVFSKKTTAVVSDGFSASGNLASSSTSYTVSLQPGLTGYTSALYQGDASYIPLPSNFSAANSSASSSSPKKTDTFSSLLLTSPSYAILALSSSNQRLVVWDSIPDVGELKGGKGSGGVKLVDVQGTGYTCATGFFGKSCEACPAGCKDCDDGLTGSGLCLDVVASNITLPSTCNCINGACATNSSTATCTCNAGWTKASNGTQCAACADGFYMSSEGDCLACDPTCATCSSPSGACLTCHTGLASSSSSSTSCVPATTALSNGTFTTCPSGTYFSKSADGCTACNSVCGSCYGAGSDECTSCKSPYVLLGGACVAVDEKTGVCDSGAAGNGTSGGGYVYDNEKKACDALPAQCTAGGIDSFSSSSSRSQLTCSKCLPGSFLVEGDCVSNCPDGYLVSDDGLSCEACDKSCATCSTSPTFCTSCASSSSPIINGTCITSSSCPSGYFSQPSTNLTSSTTCLACHPDCATCSDSPTTCTSCPSSRPVLSSSGACVPTCASDEYYDTAKSSCVSCSSDCATCSASGSDACLSCASGSRLKSGKCVAADDCAAGGWVGGFGVCLSDLVTVKASSAAEETAQGGWTIPWWLILVIVLVTLALVGGGLWWFRKREQKRRREHTQRFAKGLGDKEVDKKLAALPVSIAYPSAPSAPHSPSCPTNPAHLAQDATYNIPLTPRFVLEDPSSPVSPAPSKSSYGPSEAAPLPRKLGSRWSASSLASSAFPGAKQLQPQPTGSSAATSSTFFSPPKERTFTTKAGNTLLLTAGTTGTRSCEGEARCCVLLAVLEL
ncbi:hypothetical protein JCM10213v2_001580 [Rhodosporidiobolus nylandii]